MVAFHSPLELWTNYLWSGFPAAADPQYESWYPLARLFRLLPYGFNAFMTLAYVLASCFTYGYVFSLTGRRFSALVSGTIFGMSGFLMSHLAHSAMLQAMIWLPLVIWSLEKLRRRFSVPWFVVAVVAAAANILGGHLQIFVYTWLLALGYAVFLGAKAGQGRPRYVATCLAALTLAGCLSAIQLLPTLELSRLSGRTALTFEEFVSFSLPPRQLIHLIFPVLYGGNPYSAYRIPYFGVFNYQELNGYVGVLPLILAAVGAWVFRSQRLVLFWASVALVALFLVLGDATPLAALLYRIPVVNYFRGPVRHFLEWSFAISVLAGFGVAAFQASSASARLGRKVVVGAVMGLLASCALVWGYYDRLRATAAASASEIRLPSFIANPAVIVPALTFALSIAAFAIWYRVPRARARQIGLWTMILVNSATFGWFCEWRYLAIDAGTLQGSFLNELKPDLDTHNQRILPVGGVGGPTDMYRLYKLNNVLGYGPLMLKRYSELSGISTSGSISPAGLSERNHSIDLLAVAYFLEPVNAPSTVPPGARFQRVERVGGATVFRNLRAMPRAWLVPEVQTAPADSIRASIAESKPLPGGNDFDPQSIALIEEPLEFKASNPDPNGKIRIAQIANTRIDLESSSQTPSFLVMSDIYYPGWKASVNGVDTHIFQTDYILRGILLPAGRNNIRVEFRPWTVYAGAILSGLTLAGLLVLLVIHPSSRSSSPQVRWTSPVRSAADRRRAGSDSR